MLNAPTPPASSIVKSCFVNSILDTTTSKLVTFHSVGYEDVVIFNRNINECPNIFNNWICILLHMKWESLVSPNSHAGFFVPDRQKLLSFGSSRLPYTNLRSCVIYLFYFILFLLLCFFGSRGKKITPDTFI